MSDEQNGPLADALTTPRATMRTLPTLAPDAAVSAGDRCPEAAGVGPGPVAPARPGEHRP